MAEISKIELDAYEDAKVCKHEWVADFSSLVAVILLFASVYLIMRFHNVTLDWMTDGSMLQSLAAYAIVLIDAVLIVSLLCFGPSCHEHNKSCFGTFKGRKR
jgi:flagellar biogenesis protein FliO